VSGVEEGLPRQIDGVLFDYGETLVEFSRPVDALAEAHARMLAVLAEAGHGRVSRESLRAVLDRVDQEVIEYQRTEAPEEMDLPAVALRAYEDAGIRLDEGVLDDLLRIEQEAWWHGARVDPDAVPLLDFLHDRGVRTGICSNAPYRARSLHEQIAFLRLDTHLDAVTFSAEVGWRKPSTRMFDAALRALGTSADRTVMVGDREATDIAGAHAAGMRAVLLNRHEERGANSADAEIASLRDLPGALRDMGIYFK
jgi:HAD superfamily hydrolase (TIGR01662 family)